MNETSVLSRLSLAAVRSAAALGIRNVSALFEHLYAYNTVPSTETLEQRLSDAEKVRRQLGLMPGVLGETQLARHWAELPRDVAKGWLTWVRPSRYARLAGPGSAVQFKLYLSPAVEALPTSVAAWVETLSFSQAISVKVGADMSNLLRPDKAVAYFHTQADLAESVRQLADRLVGVPAQGVPFTAEIAGDGLLSWGVDPPARGRALSETARSWREWVCYQLAVGLAEAHEEGRGDTPDGQRAVERLRRMGVDTELWLPPPASWGSALL